MSPSGLFPSGLSLDGVTSISQVKRIISNKLHGVFMCECYPKKPKKFETGEELKLVPSIFEIDNH
jgi:hypothetical protein